MYLNGTRCVAIALGCLLSLSTIAKNTTPEVGQGVQKPLCFIENKGQLVAKDATEYGDIQFRLSTAGMNLFVGNGALHYQFRQVDNSDENQAIIHSYQMDVSLVGANPNSKITKSGMLDYFETYYTTGVENGITAHAYNKITYHDVYPGIDWVLYLNQSNIEYDFVVRPGADVSLIKLHYGGATDLSIGADGGIVAKTPMGTIREKSPYAYENKTGKAVAANFKIENNNVSFETGAHNGTLTIDPFVMWSTYFGGANEDVATAVTVSPGGNIYIGGYTSSNSVGLAPGNDPTFNGLYDAFISKYNSAGTLQWTTYVGGTGNDRGTCLAIDASGTNIYLGGFTNSGGLATFGAYHMANSGMYDGFLYKIRFNGPRVWCTYYGGAGNDYVYGVAHDGAPEGVYITGRTESAALIASAGAYQTALSGSADAFVAKFDATSARGDNIYSTYYGGTGVDEGAAITVDGTGKAVITGQTNSTISIASAGAHQGVLSGPNDAFVAMLNATGDGRVWGTYYGGTSADQGKGISCNTTTGDVAVIGYTSSSTGIATPKAHQTTYGGGVQDAFVSYFSNSGNLKWGSYYGGTNLDYGEGVCFDADGHIVIAGGTFSNTGIASPMGIQPTIAGNYDAFTAKFTVLGQRIWGTYFGDAFYDYAFGVVCDNSNNGEIIMAGHTTSTAGIATAGAASTSYGGGTYDAFLTKFRRDTIALINQPYTDTLVCAGGTLTLDYGVNYNFQPGNTFTAQLSDATGSFASPTDIGTLLSSGFGTIICNIPSGVTPGTGYRIRITGSAPAYISPDQYMDITIVSALPLTTVTANTPICVGNTLSLTCNGTWSISSYIWAGPASYSSALQNPSIPGVSLANGGTYSVTTTHNGCPDNVSTINVVVNDAIPPSPTAFSSTLNCAGGTLYLYADTGVSATGNYEWTGPAGFSSTMRNPTLSPISSANSGDYYVVDTVGGCPSVPTLVSVSVTPNTPVSITINVSPNDTVCGGALVSFTSVPVNGGVSPTYQWMNSGVPVVGAITGAWSTSSLTDGAEITCVMTSTAVCPSPLNAVSNPIKMHVITNEPVVTIFANPGTSVAPGDSVVFTSAVYNAGVGPTYQWNRNGLAIFGATNSSYTHYNVTQFDTITLVVTSTMACATPSIATSNALVAHPNTAVTDVSSLLNNITLFPNPNPGNFTITGDLAGMTANKVTISVINPLGQVVYSSDASLFNNKLNKEIRLDNLASGIYLLKVSADDVSKVIRFSVQR